MQQCPEPSLREPRGCRRARQLCPSQWRGVAQQARAWNHVPMTDPRRSGALLRLMLVLALLVATALGVREALLPDPSVSAAGRTGTDRSAGTSSPHSTAPPPRSSPSGIYANPGPTDFSPAVRGDPELV